MTSGRGLRLGEAALGGGLLLLGVTVATETARLHVAPSYAAVGPRLFPYLIAAGLIVVALLVLRQAVAGHIAHEGGFELDWQAVALISGGLVAQMLLIERLGWIPSATLMFACVARAFGSRRIALDAGIGLVLTAFAFVAFNYGLDLRLPAGAWIEALTAGN